VLTHPTEEKLRKMQLVGMADALADQLRTPDVAALTFEDRLGLLVDREETARANRRLKTRLTQARLRLPACVEDIDYRSRRGLSKSVVLALGSCRWVQDHLNVLITGPTGVGKTYLACALAQQACRQGLRALYARLPRLCHDLEIARADGSYRWLLAKLAKQDLLVLDDWGMAPLTPDGRRDLLEILDDRYQARSTLITSQLPVAKWHQYLDDPTLADAILDRVIHNAHRIELEGESLRKGKGEVLTRAVEAG
jgi:DNA replication protein DnaC